MLRDMATTDTFPRAAFSVEKDFPPTKGGRGRGPSEFQGVYDYLCPAPVGETVSILRPDRKAAEHARATIIQSVRQRAIKVQTRTEKLGDGQIKLYIRKVANLA